MEIMNSNDPLIFFKIYDVGENSGVCSPSCMNNTNVLGVNGYCSSDNTKCICPSGYDGNDNWDDYGDCHVNINVRVAFNGVNAFVSFVSFLYSTYLMLQLIYLWRFDILPDILRDAFESLYNKVISLFTNCIKINENDGKHPSSSTSSHSKTNSHGKSFYNRNKQVRQAHQIIFCMLLLFFFGSLGTFTYCILTTKHQSVYRYQNNVLLALSFNLAATSLLISIWGIVLLWFVSLPNLKVYGTLFSLNSLFVRDPHFIPRAVFLVIFLIIVIAPIILVFIPLSRPELRIITDSIFLSLSALNVFLWLIYVTLLSFLLKSAYKKSLIALSTLESSPIAKNDAVEQRRRSNFNVPDRKVFTSAIKRINITLVVCWAGGALTVVVLIGMAFNPYFRTNAHISFNVIALTANQTCIMFCFVLVRGSIDKFREQLQSSNNSPIGQTPNQVGKYNPGPINEVTEPLDINSVARSQISP